MPHAIIVVGNERRFIDASRPFARHLRKKARCERVSVLRAAYSTPAELIARLRAAIGMVPRGEVLLVAYFGHGQKGSWGFALEHQEKYLHLDYATLAKTLARHPGPLAILNDCCHAESLAPHLKKAGIGEDRCLLISACKTEETAIPGTGAEVLSQWNAREVFEPIAESSTTCLIDMTPYVPPIGVRVRRWWMNALIRLRNRFRPAKARQPTYIFVNSPPNGWAKHVEETEHRTIGRRWGATLDHHFFPKPA